MICRYPLRFWAFGTSDLACCFLIGTDSTASFGPSRVRVTREFVAAWQLAWTNEDLKPAV